MRRLRPAAGPLLLLIVVTGFYWKLVTRQYTWMDHPDMANQILPWYQTEAAAFHRGEFPLWDPNTWGGQPILGQMQPGAAYPLNWILFLLPLQNGHVNLFLVQLSFIFAHVLGAWFCYWLCRDLDCSVGASILGGAAFSLAGVTGWLGWPQFLNGAIWMPLVLLFFLRSARGERQVANAALSGTFLGVTFLSGHHQIPTFTALMMGGLWIHELVRRRRAAWPALAAFALFAALAGALQLAPAYEYGVRAVRWVGSQNPVGWNQAVPYIVHQQLSMAPSSLVGLVLPVVTEDGMFIGFAVFVLAMFALPLWFERAEVRVLAAIAAGGVVLALGANTMFQGVAYLSIPLIEKARSPSMAIVLAQFALAVLAAFGVDRMARHPLSARWAAILGAFGGLVWMGVAVATTLRPPVQREYEHWAVLGLVALALASLRVARRALPAVVVLLALFEWSTYIGQDYQHREKPAGYLARLDGDADLVAFLKQRPDLVRIGVDLNTIPYNFGDWNGLEVYQAYLAGLTGNILTAEAAGAPRLFGLNYFIGGSPSRDSQKLVFHARSGANVYKDSEASPRAWVVHDAVQVERAELVPRLQTSDLQRRVFLTEAAPALETCAGDEVRVTMRTAARTVIATRLSCRGMVLLSDTWYPGWQATLDGIPAKIYEADGAIRGVVAEAGSHTIEMRYRPRSVFAGAGLTAVGLLGALVLGIRGRRVTPTTYQP